MSIKHSDAAVRLRATGILMLFHGEKAWVVANRSGMSLPTVYNWRKAWEGCGLVGLMTGRHSGRPPKLTQDWIETAVKIAQEEALTLRGIARRAQEIHGSPFPSSLYRLAAALNARGFSFKGTRWSLKKAQRRTLCCLCARTERAEILGACPRMPTRLLR